MRKSRFSEAQIVAIRKEFDAGAPAEQLARRHGITRTRFGCGGRSTLG
jgi:hypothetical protein